MFQMPLQVQILQQDCNILRHNIQLSQETLQKEQEKIVQLEQECIHLKADLGIGIKVLDVFYFLNQLVIT